MPASWSAASPGRTRRKPTDARFAWLARRSGVRAHDRLGRGAGEPAKLVEGRGEHRVGRACRGPDRGVLPEVTVDVDAQPGRPVDRGVPADRLAGGCPDLARGGHPDLG